MTRPSKYQMTAEEKPELAVILLKIANAFNTPLTEARIEVFFDALSDEVSIEDMKRAYKYLIKNSKFFPVPFDIMEAVEETRPTLDDIRQAWAANKAHIDAMLVRYEEAWQGKSWDTNLSPMACIKAIHCELDEYCAPSEIIQRFIAIERKYVNPKGDTCQCQR